jgi:hypothetical protein
MASIDDPMVGEQLLPAWDASSRSLEQQPESYHEALLDASATATRKTVDANTHAIDGVEFRVEQSGVENSCEHDSTRCGDRVLIERTSDRAHHLERLTIECATDHGGRRRRSQFNLGAAVLVLWQAAGSCDTDPIEALQAYTEVGGTLNFALASARFVSLSPTCVKMYYRLLEQPGAPSCAPTTPVSCGGLGEKESERAAW